MTFTYRPARRQNVPLLLGVAGGTGSGKTFSALRLARGIAQGKPFAGLDTENGRMLHYADLFPELQHGRLDAPFRPERYAEAIDAADKQGFPVIVVDSTSHEWNGEGGLLDWHDQIMDGKESRQLIAWAKPKQAHKRMVSRLLQVNAHVILCFRAEPKVEMVDDPDKPGKKMIVQKKSAQKALDGWHPITEGMLPYELTASFLLMADRPGVPKPIKLQEQHRPFVPLDSPLSEEVGLALAEWAAGSSTGKEPQAGRDSDARPVSQASADTVSASSGLSMTEWRARTSAVPADLIRAVGSGLFPGRPPASLTDHERAQVWAAIEEAQSVAT